MRELICIMCPKGCSLYVDEENEFKVSGNECAKGEAYGKAECLNPTRVVTSTVAIEGAIHERCPVKTNLPIPKELALDAVKALSGITLRSPVKMGTAALKNVCGAGADFVVARDM